VRRITIRLRPIHEHRELCAAERHEMGCAKLPLFDVKLVGAIAVALLALAMLLIPEPVQELTRARVARGEVGAQITAFAISPTSALIATTNATGCVALRSPETEWRIEQFLDFPGYATAVAFSPDSLVLAAGGIPPGICLWDPRSHTSEPTQTLPVPIQQVSHLAFSPDGKTLAATTYLDGTILIWDLATQRDRLVLHHPSPVVCVAFSPDGRWLATAGRSDWSILIWDLQSGSRRTLLEHGPGPLLALAFSPDGAFLASAGIPEHEVRLWDLETQRVCRVIGGHTRSVTSVAFSPDGSLLATAGNDGMLGLWTVATGQRRVSLDSQSAWPQTVVFSPDGRFLVLATGSDDDIRSWDVAELLRAAPVPSVISMKKGSAQLRHQF
jgi:WD40 repeat protein